MIYNAGVTKFFNDIGITELGDQYDGRVLLTYYYFHKEDSDSSWEQIEFDHFKNACTALGCDTV